MANFAHLAEWHRIRFPSLAVFTIDTRVCVHLMPYVINGTPSIFILYMKYMEYVIPRRSRGTI